eukprot:77220_1
MKPTRSQLRRGRRKKQPTKPRRPPLSYKKQHPSYDSDSSSQSVESFSHIPWIYTHNWKRTNCADRPELHDTQPQTLPSYTHPNPPSNVTPNTPIPTLQITPEPKEAHLTDEVVDLDLDDIDLHDIDLSTIPLFTKIINDIKDEDDLNTLSLMLSLEPTISRLSPEIDAHAIVGAASIIISYCGQNAFKSTSHAAKKLHAAKAIKQAEAELPPLPEPPKTKFSHTPILSTTPITWPGFSDSPADVSIPTIAVPPSLSHFKRQPPRPHLPQSNSIPSLPTTAVSHPPRSTFVPHVRPAQMVTQMATPEMMNEQVLISQYVNNVYRATRIRNNVNTLMQDGNVSHAQQWCNQNINAMNTMNMRYDTQPGYIYAS